MIWWRRMHDYLRFIKNKRIKINVTLVAGHPRLWSQHIENNRHKATCSSCTSGMDLSERAWNTQIWKSWQKSGYEKDMPTLHNGPGSEQASTWERLKRTQVGINICMAVASSKTSLWILVLLSPRVGWKQLSDDIIAPIYTLQRLPTTLRMKSKILCMTYPALGDAAPACLPSCTADMVFSPLLGQARLLQTHNLRTEAGFCGIGDLGGSVRPQGLLVVWPS